MNQVRLTGAYGSALVDQDAPAGTVERVLKALGGPVPAVDDEPDPRQTVRRRVTGEETLAEPADNQDHASGDGLGAPAGPPVVAVLRLSTGASVPVRGPVVIGRAPRRQPDTTGPVDLVTVPSTDHMVSRCHLELTVTGSNVLARDLETDNGTVLLRQGLEPVLLASTVTTPLLVGDFLDLGDGVTVRLDPA